MCYLMEVATIYVSAQLWLLAESLLAGFLNELPEYEGVRP